MRQIGRPISSKIRKRKREGKDYIVLRSHRREGGPDSDSDSERSSRSGPKSSKGLKSNSERQNWFSSLLSGIESRPNLPNILSYYAQLTLNFFVISLVIYGIYTFWITIRSDVDKASQDAKDEVLNEIAKCAKDYVDNRCGPDIRVKALEAVCENWERCMNRDPTSVGRARISAHTFALIFNSFIEPISYKAMIFIVLLITVSILVNNLAFSMFRSKAAHPAPPFAPQAHFPPPTPHQSHPAWQAPTPYSQSLGYGAYGEGARDPFAIMPGGGGFGGNEGRSPSKGSRSPSKGNRY